MRKKFIILIISIISLLLWVNSVKAYAMYEWQDISNFTLPSGITTETHNIIVFIENNTSFYSLIVEQKNNGYYFGGPEDSSPFPYYDTLCTSTYNGVWGKQYRYKSSALNNYDLTTIDYSEYRACWGTGTIVYTNTDIYNSFYQATGGSTKWFDYNIAFPPITYPTFENTMYVEGDKIKLQYTFTQWTDTQVDYIKTGPLLQKTYTRQDYLQDNTFSINIRMPQQNYLVPIEYYDSNNNILKTDYINLHEVLENMPQDQQNEIVAQEEYQKDIYQWESGDYSSTIKDTINNSSQVIKWARDLVQYIFDSFPSEVKYAIISAFIVFLICCIIRMIWR